MPSSLVIMGDNTVRELKNQYCTSYLGALLSKRKLRLCAAFFLRKSHTHDRIDQMWGVLSRRIASTDTILNDSDTCKTIELELSRVGVRQWLGSHCEVHVEKMNCVCFCEKTQKIKKQRFFGIFTPKILGEDEPNCLTLRIFFRMGWWKIHQPRNYDLTEVRRIFFCHQTENLRAFLGDSPRLSPSFIRGSFAHISRD